MYEKCLECKKLGNPCDGPNFMAMSTEDLIQWCNARKKQLPGLTYDRIVEKTGLSKGTVSAFFTAAHADYRIETIRPILKLLVGGEWEDSPCGDPTAEERHNYEERIQHLEAEIAWRDDKIKHLTDTAAHDNEQIAFLKHAIGNKNKTILTLAILLALALGVIIAALIIDRLNSDIGFFWLESLLPNRVNDIIQRWRT